MESEIKDSNTFERVNATEQEACNELSLSGYIRSGDKQKLPMLYASTKMHKNPIGFRFITAGRDTILQNLSISVSKCLKLLLKTANMSFNYKIKGIENHISIIDNRNKVINFINLANNSNGDRKCISTWDFSTLYTNIPHDQLKANIRKFVCNIFECNEKVKNPKKFVCSSDYRKIAYYSKSRSRSNNVCFDRNQLIDAIEFIIDHSYIKFHNNIFRQQIGIPMGTNCAPFLANIYLHVYEYDYIKALISKGDISTAKCIANMFRYQDDCVSINDNGLFSRHLKYIYPKEMVLKSTNISRDKCTFLDLTISIYRGRFVYYMFDKRDDFGFAISNYPNLKGNIPSMLAYGVYTSQIGRLCDVNSSAKRFFHDLAKMTVKFTTQGFDITKLYKRYKDFLNKSMWKWSKFNYNMFRNDSISKIFKGC